MQVPDGWEVKPLKDILTIQYGKDQKEVESESGKYPILGSGGVIGYTNNFLYDKPSVLIGRKGTINNPQYMETPFWTVDTLFYSHIKNKNVPKWVFYVFQSINWDSYNEASGVPSLSTANINRIEVLRPTVKEQEQIAKILSTLDKNIETTNRLIEKEKNIKKALMQELLTNGIDKDGHIRTRATHAYKESELGLIPEEWELVSLDDFFKLKSGDTKPEDTSDSGIYEVYGGNGITGYSNSKNNNDETLIIGRVGEYCGSIYLVNECWITDNALYITKKVKKFDTQYMFYLLHFLNLNKYKSETGQPLLNQTTIGNVKTSYPKDKYEQKQIAKILTTQDKKIEIEETNLAKLKELKKGLMNDLLSGKVRVKSA